MNERSSEIRETILQLELLADHARQQCEADQEPFPGQALVARVLLLVAEHVVHVVVQALFGHHDLFDQAQRDTQRQSYYVVVGTLDLFDKNGTAALYAVAAGFVVAVASSHVGYQDRVRHCPN